MEIVSNLWPESEDKWDALSDYIRGYIRTFRKAFSLVSPYPLIESSATTADIYAHLDYSAQEASANAMNGMFSRESKKEETA